MIVTTYTYRVTCDWPSGCGAARTLHGLDTVDGAMAAMRREGWTISRTHRGDNSGRREVRCENHAFIFAVKPTGRPRKIAA